jgi:murein DD-endopeptidase MepM/ murein hydrolase activator NlpD
MPQFIDVPADGPVTQRFGDMFSGYPHRGHDIGVPVGTPVYAPAGGISVQFTNSRTRWNGAEVRSFGDGVCLDHGDGWWSLYAHLSVNLAPFGTIVRAGDRIGLSGNTGVSTGPHLHWQLSDAPSFPTDINQSRDPLAFLIPESERMAIFQRLEQVVQALGGDGEIARWNTMGNSLLLGFALEQTEQDQIQADLNGVKVQVANHEAGVAQAYALNGLMNQWRAVLTAHNIYLP